MAPARRQQAGQYAVRSAEVDRNGEDGGSGDGDGDVQRGAGEQRAATSGGGGATGDSELLNWWEVVSVEQLRAIAASGGLTHKLHARKKKLSIEAFTGDNNEPVEAWLATVHNEVERQQTLNGEQWTSQQLFHGASACLKNKAARWFVNINARLEQEDRTFEHFAELLRSAFGHNESAFEVQLKVGRREQQPAERLHDFATSLRGIALGHDVPEECLVEAFTSGINNQLTSTHVRVRGPQTLTDAVQLAVKTGGSYGVGYKIKDWRAAEQAYTDDRILTEREDGTLTPTPTKQQHGEDLDEPDAVAAAEAVGRAVTMHNAVVWKEETTTTEENLGNMHTESYTGRAKRKRREKQRAARRSKQRERDDLAECELRLYD